MLRVVQPRRRLRLAAEPLQGQAVCRDLAGQDLQRHLAAQADLLGLVDDPHPAPADLAEDPVIAQPPLLARGWGRRGLRAVGPGVVVDRQVLSTITRAGSSSRIWSASSAWRAARSSILGRWPARNRARNDSATTSKGSRSTAGSARKSCACGWASSNCSTRSRSAESPPQACSRYAERSAPAFFSSACEEDRFHLRRTGHGTAPLRRVPLFNATNHSRGRNNGGLHATRGDTVRDRQSRPSATWGLSRGLGHRWLKAVRSLCCHQCDERSRNPSFPLKIFSRFFGIVRGP